MLFELEVIGQKHAFSRDERTYYWVKTAKKTKTYNRRDSQMVTHSSTSRPVQCLCVAERTELFSITFLYLNPGS
jgi:hypothetical protein